MAGATHNDGLQLPRAAKRSDGKPDKDQAHGDRNTDEPVRGVAGPRPESHIQPAQRQQGKNGTDGLVE